MTERMDEILRRFEAALYEDLSALTDTGKQQALLNAIVDDVFINGTSTDHRQPVGILSIQ